MNPIKNLSRKKVLSAICPITGTTIELSIPNIEGFAFVYSNPLSIYENALGIASLPYKNKVSLGKELLAGSILSLIHHYQLVHDKTSGIERNILLQSCSEYTLHLFLSLFVQHSAMRCRNFPHFSFQALLETDLRNSPQSIQDSILSYIEACENRQAIESTKLTSGYIYSAPRTSKPSRKPVRISQASRNRMRDCIAVLSRDSRLSSKVISLLNLISQKDNLLNLSEAIRNKLVSILSDIDEPEAAELSTILEAKENKQENEVDIEQHFSSPIKKSLKDILASKINEEEEPVESVSIPSKETLEEEEETKQDSVHSFIQDLIEAESSVTSVGEFKIDEDSDFEEMEDLTDIYGDPDEF